MRRNLAFPAIGVATALALGGASTALASSGSSAPINVGVIAPFSGPAAEFGTLLSAPCQAATWLINRDGGVLGHKLQCTPVDDTGDPADAVPNVTRAISTISNFDMAIGLESNTAATTGPIVNQARIPYVTTNGLVSYNRTHEKYFWRLTPADNANGVAFAVWAIEKHYKRVAVVFENNIGSQGNLPGILAAMPKLHGTITNNLTIPADATSYSSVVSTIISKHPQALIFSGDPQTTATFMANYSQLNNGHLPPMITATDSLTPDFFNAVSKAVGKSYIFNDVYLVGSYFSNNTPAFKAYKGAMVANPLTRKIADVITTVGPPASAYDGMTIMALAMLMAKSIKGSVYNSYIPKVVSKKSGAVVVNTFAEGKKALSEGKKIQFVGVVGPVAFNQYHNFSGQFAASRFTAANNAHQLSVISGAEVSRLLG
ncbi:MAG TPA: ABC transporter substrate-binding protein [Candidatus Dormibacteraeota bacterium]|nr:ABC transporter substrate-binding protein [Candidatus Dormibacteraeota bacterium]